MLSRTALRRSLLHVSAVLLLGLSAAWPSVASAAPKTVCTVTINSSDEKEAFQRHLPRDQYQFVELVQRGKWRWNASFSSDELIVTVHTVFGAALAASGQAAARPTSRTADTCNRDRRSAVRDHMRRVFHKPRRR